MQNLRKRKEPGNPRQKSCQVLPSHWKGVKCACMLLYAVKCVMSSQGKDIFPAWPIPADSITHPGSGSS